MSLATLVLAASACTGGRSEHVQLTPDGPAYQVRSAGQRITISNTASGGNNRELLFDAAGHDAADGRSCATWEAGSGIAQQGIAFRIRRGPDGWRAVVLERNIWLEQYWLFVGVYFNAADSRSDAATPTVAAPVQSTAAAPVQGTAAAPVQSTDPVSLAEYLGSPAAVYPLRVCAELRDGVLAFAVAKGRDPMVPPGTPGRGGSFRVRSDLVPATGRTGSYVAHIPVGTSTVIGDVTIDGRSAALPSS